MEIVVNVLLILAGVMVIGLLTALGGGAILLHFLRAVANLIANVVAIFKKGG